MVWSPGYSVGYLPQDPPLDENKTVAIIGRAVMTGLKDAVAEMKRLMLEARG